MSTISFNIIPPLISLMHNIGIKRVIVSSGSRCFPIVAAIVRSNKFDVIPIVDERVAAFMAAGMAQALSDEPIALVCTSGSAVLNYGPAIAEAYYSRLPLLVISADRPSCRLDQNEGQMINQTGILNNIVAGWADVDVTYSDYSNLLKSFTSLADTIRMLRRPVSRPVHVNIHLSEPLSVPEIYEMPSYTYDMIAETISDSNIAVLAEKISRAKRVMIYVAPGYYSGELVEILTAFSKLPNIVIVSEVASSLGGRAISGFDSIASHGDDVLKKEIPEFIISIGGAPISRKFKQFIFDNQIENWHIAPQTEDIDTFHTLKTMLHGDPPVVLREVYNAISLDVISSNYAMTMHQLAIETAKEVESYSFSWSDIGALKALLSSLHDCNLCCSNGMLIRYIDMLSVISPYSRVFCNRGVSGIDGSTSMAIGTTSVSDKQTIFLSGDLSAQYDLGALFATPLPHNFRMIVFYNGGGDIFRVINATCELPERERYLSCPTHTMEIWRGIASAASMDCLEASSYESLNEALGLLLLDDNMPKLLIINTKGVDNRMILHKFLNRNKLK